MRLVTAACLVRCFYCLSNTFPNTVQKTCLFSPSSILQLHSSWRKNLNEMQGDSPSRCCCCAELIVLFYGCFIWGLILVFSNQVYWLDLLQSQICLSFILMMTMIGYCVFSLLFSLPFLEKIPREPPDNLQMTSNNFQHILSWRAHSDPTVPTYYRVLYSSHRQVLLHIRHNLFFLCLSVQNTQPCYFLFLSVFPLHKDAFI